MTRAVGRHAEAIDGLIRLRRAANRLSEEWERGHGAAAAIEDVFGSLGVAIDNPPLSPSRQRALVREAQAEQDQADRPTQREPAPGRSVPPPSPA